MPLYEFINEETQEVFTKIMSVSAMETYLDENKTIKMHYSSAPALCDSVRLGIRKPDANFRDMLKHISKRAGMSSTIRYD